MNIKEYIESGILDVYVLGGLSTAESAEVEELSRKHPEVRKEIDLISSSIERLTVIENKIPSMQLKNNILKSIEDSSTINLLENQTPVVDLNKEKSSSWMIFSIAASWLLVALFGGLSYHFYSKWQDSQSQLIALQGENKELADNFNVTNYKFKEATSQLSLINDSSLKIVILKAVPGKPSTFANVLWSKANHEVYISSNSLPQTPSGRQYQLWAIVNGKPVDAGMIATSDSGGLLKMKDIKNATAFAITLEKEGGSENPTMEEMYVMGLI